MAHFAKVNDDGIVEEVLVINNEMLLDENGVEQEEIGKKFFTDTFGGNWVQTSYNRNFRKNYAAIGYVYDSIRDAFYEPKIADSWILDEDTCIWMPPIPYPEDGNIYRWNEETISWDFVQKDNLLPSIN